MGYFPAPGPVREPVLDNQAVWQKKALVFLFLAAVVGISVAMCVCPPRDGVINEAAPPTAPDGGDQTFMMACTALVFIMIPGIAFFYGGMVTHKNVIGCIAVCLMPLAIIPFLWAIFGFTLAFGDATGYPNFIGQPQTFGLMYNVGDNLFGTITYSVFFSFQAMFAILTPAILLGSICDRVNFASLFVFVPIWHLVVYCPMAHMLFGSGFIITEYDFHDFAGGAVVHMTSGFGALAASYFMGPRKTMEEPAPANIPYTVLGGALLWFGWYGFNAGSQVAADAVASHAAVTTTIATAASMITWMFLDQIAGKTYKATGLAMGIVVGLVAITPGCAYVNYGGAGIIGMVVCCFCYGAQFLMVKFGHSKADDTLDVFAAHGVGGFFGSIMTSLLQTQGASAGTRAEGGFYGNGPEFGRTLLICVILAVWFTLATYVIMWVTNLFISVRVTEEEEEEGLDFSKHFEGKDTE
mmetsp:Transcript_33129/g.98563  ORF Transcript_33129/g.98563 Transcript_33129/m.98563 type:complete len:467 (-) Transcript_33129:307-1707(-)